MTTWSYSSLTAFETCARRYEITKISKRIKEPQTEAMMHGTEVHAALEHYVADGTPLPAKYKQYIPIVEAVTKAPGEKFAEMKFGLTKDLAPTEFFGDDVWVRGVLDLTIVQGDTAIVLDWKTGKPKADPSQLELFSAATLALYPTVTTVKSAFVWLAHGKVDPHTLHRGEEDEVWRGFSSRVRRMELSAEEEHYPPKPSGLCKSWCPVPRSLCEFSGKR